MSWNDGFYSNRYNWMSGTLSYALNSSNTVVFVGVPTYQKQSFFIRGDFSLVHAINSTPGNAFGLAGLNASQPHGALEAGFMF